MEYASGGELFSYIVKKKRLEDDEASFFFIQIMNAIEYIHKNNIVHRDLKPENLLLTENNILKVIDFGLSNHYRSGFSLETPCGSPCYAAPEMILGKKYSGLMVDIWSSGIILYAMVCGYLPFEDKNNEKLYKKIIECKLDFPTYVSNITKDLIKKILTVNPKKRIKIEEIKSHPFFNIGKTFFQKNNSNLHNVKTKINDTVLQQMEDLGFEKNDVCFNLENNKHNNITTTYNLLLNKLKETGKTYSSIISERSPEKTNENSNSNINININYMNKIGNININIKENKIDYGEARCMTSKDKFIENNIKTSTPTNSKNIACFTNKTRSRTTRTSNPTNPSDFSPGKITSSNLIYDKNKKINCNSKKKSVKNKINTSSNSRIETKLNKRALDNSTTTDLPNYIEKIKDKGNNLIAGITMITTFNKFKSNYNQYLNLPSVNSETSHRLKTSYLGAGRTINTSVSIDKNFDTFTRNVSETDQNTISIRKINNNSPKKIINNHSDSDFIENNFKRSKSLNQKNRFRTEFKIFQNSNIQIDEISSRKRKRSSFNLVKENNTTLKTIEKKVVNENENLNKINSLTKNPNNLKNIISNFRKKIKQLSIEKKPEIESLYKNYNRPYSNSQNKYERRSFRNKSEIREKSVFINNTSQNLSNSNNLIPLMPQQTLNSNNYNNPSNNSEIDSVVFTLRRDYPKSQFPNSTKNSDQLYNKTLNTVENKFVNTSMSSSSNNGNKRKIIDLKGNIKANLSNNRQPSFENHTDPYGLRSIIHKHVIPVTTVNLLTESSLKKLNTNLKTNNSKFKYEFNSEKRKINDRRNNNDKTNIKSSQIKDKESLENLSKLHHTNSLTKNFAQYSINSSVKKEKYITRDNLKINHSSKNYTIYSNHDTSKDKLQMNSNKTKNPNTDFACFTLSESKAIVLNIKLEEYCQNNSLNLKEISSKKFECTKDNNTISLEITKYGDNKVMKLQHLSGNESITKDIIKNLLLSIAF